MIKKLIPVACLTALLGFSAPSLAQFGDVAKATGKATEQTAKTAGKAGKKVTEGAKTAGTETKDAIAGRPQGTTGLCRDGTYTKAKTHSGACSGHAGVQKWF
jgi:hypothetical protein